MSATLKREMTAAGYVQLFRSGQIEAVEAYNHEHNGVRVMNIWQTEEEVIDAITRYVAVLTEAGVEPPISVLLSLVGVRGYGLVPSPQRDHRTRPLVARDVVTLPDVLIEDPKVDAPRMLHPVFDALWQTFGQPRSYCYDESESRVRNFRW